MMVILCLGIPTKCFLKGFGKDLPDSPWMVLAGFLSASARWSCPLCYGDLFNLNDEEGFHPFAWSHRVPFRRNFESGWPFRYRFLAASRASFRVPAFPVPCWVVLSVGPFFPKKLFLEQRREVNNKPFFQCIIDRTQMRFRCFYHPETNDTRGNCGGNQFKIAGFRSIVFQFLQCNTSIDYRLAKQLRSFCRRHVK